MGRNAIWKSIADALRAEIAAGHYPLTEKLPTEAQLAARFGVNRHTVRRALAELSEAGLVLSRRGSGVFVSARPMEYPLGRRVRFHQNLAAAGRLPTREILRLETRRADPREAGTLALPEGAAVHVYEGLSLGDGAPIALSRSVFPADRFPGLPARLAATLSVTEALAGEGLSDYTRAFTRITARIANATQAHALRLREGAPILRTEAVNVDSTGQPVEFGLTWFAGDRVMLSVAPD